MTLRSASVADTRQAVFPLPPSIIPTEACGPHDADQSSEDSWDNEGGHLPRLDSGNRSTATATTADVEIETLATEVHLLANTLSRDFANGRVGTRYNTYGHRSRVLRQLTAKLDAMRAQKAGFKTQERRQ